MADLLVTGGAGFIGTNFVRYWAERHPNDRITVLDALTYAGTRASLVAPKQARFVEGDIRDTRLVCELLGGGIDTLVHFAAETHVDRSITNPGIFVEVNVRGTLSLLEAAKTKWLDEGGGRPHRFHHISTDEVFGSLGPDDAPFTEQSPYAPNSPYSASKAASDHLVRAYRHTYGLQTSVTNCSNNYGPFQYPEKLIPLFLINALTGEPLPIYGDGMNVRDWLHVDDHCRAIELVLQRGRIGETYNIGGGAELANHALTDLICEEVDAAFAAQPELAARFPNAPAARGIGSATLKRFVADRPGHDRRYAIDFGKIGAELGYRPARRFTEELARTAAWYIDNDNWWGPLTRT
ncbi:MAG TPA: dTDP-glucose 4,6-dehydratase [Allosphingosinicella sp.]